MATAEQSFLRTEHAFRCRRSCYLWLDPGNVRSPDFTVPEYKPIAVIRALYSCLMCWRLEPFDGFDAASSWVTKVVTNCNLKSLCRLGEQILLLDLTVLEAM